MNMKKITNMKKMLCLRDSISIFGNINDKIIAGKFYYIMEHDEPLSHNYEEVYEVFNTYCFGITDEYCGMFRAAHFIDLAKYRENQINEILNDSK